MYLSTPYEYSSIHNMNWSIDMVNALFGGHGRTAILRLLAAQTVPLTGRQVAELTGLSPAGAGRALEHLSALGVVTRRRVGRAITHEIQRDNVLVQTLVLPVLAAEGALIDDLRESLSETFAGAAVSVILFGSMVSGGAGPGSDLDVLVITASQKDAARASQIADESGPRFFRRYGMPLSVIVQSQETLPLKASGFLASAANSGELICGVPLKELMARASK
jgi:DNA-binding transcriptional ArsR family regulator